MGIYHLYLAIITSSAVLACYFAYYLPALILQLSLPSHCFALYLFFAILLKYLYYLLCSLFDIHNRKLL